MNGRAATALPVVAAFLTLAGSTGCRVPHPDGVSVRDSAGVEIVETHRAGWRGKAVWRVAAEPDHTVYVESRPRIGHAPPVTDATRLADGRLLVADAGSGLIRVYQGREQVDTIGTGIGTEPGQFEFLRSVDLIGDSLWAFDGMGRWTVFSSGGRIGRVTYLEPIGQGWREVHSQGNGAFVVASARRWTWGYQPPAPGVHREELALIRFDAAGRQEARSPFLGPPGYVVELAGGRTMWSPLFRGWVVTTATPDYAVVATGERAELRFYDSRGRLARLARVPGFDLALDELERGRWKELAPWWFERVHELGAEVADLAIPRQRPAFARLLSDRSGHVWANEYTLRNPSRSSRVWQVFEPGGRWMGPVVLPTGLHPFEIGPDYVLGRSISSVGYRVVSHPLYRGEAGEGG